MIIDLDVKHAQQNELISAHYRGSIPHVTILDRSGKVIYDRAGEVASQTSPAHSRRF